MNNNSSADSMTALVYESYGPPEVMHLKQVPKPVPADDQVLIRVKASSVTRYDVWARSCEAHTGMIIMMRLWFGWRTPRQPILGTELAGVVEAVGKGVKNLNIGDEVFAYPGINMGGCAEYISLPEDAVAIKPSNATFEQSASVLQGALTALYFLRKAELRPEQKILVLGASGGVGLYAVQLARHHFGAHVTGVCSPSKIDQVKSSGAHEVLDYTKEDITKRLERYDLIFDTFGMSSFATSRLLKKKGTFLFATYGYKNLLHMLWLKLATSKKVKSPLLKETNDDIVTVRKLIENDIIKPIVDRTFPLAEASDAHRYVESGKKKGGVVLLV